MWSVAILAGGLATRLRPITTTIPKSLIEVAGKPFIEHQLDYLQLQGIKSVVLCLGYLGEMIQDIVGDGSRWHMRVMYSHDGSILLGTGGALKQALPLLGEQFFILYGDSYLPINYSKVQSAYIHGRQQGLMTVLKNQNRWDRSNVHFEKGKIFEYNKELFKPQMNYIDYGLAILSACVFENYPSNQPFDLSKIYNKLSLRQQLVGYEVFERFYEIGSHQGIADTQHYLIHQKLKGII